MSAEAGVALIIVSTHGGSIIIDIGSAARVNLVLPTRPPVFLVHSIELWRDSLILHHCNNSNEGPLLRRSRRFKPRDQRLARGPRDRLSCRLEYSCRAFCILQSLIDLIFRVFLVYLASLLSY